MDDCPGDPPFVCIGGWLYSQLGMMIFGTNRKCPHCHPPAAIAPDFTDPSDDMETTG